MNCVSTLLVIALLSVTPSLCASAMLDATLATAASTTCPVVADNPLTKSAVVDCPTANLCFTDYCKCLGVKGTDTDLCLEYSAVSCMQREACTAATFRCLQDAALVLRLDPTCGEWASKLHQAMLVLAGGMDSYQYSNWCRATTCSYNNVTGNADGACSMNLNQTCVCALPLFSEFLIILKANFSAAMSSNTLREELKGAIQEDLNALWGDTVCLFDMYLRPDQATITIHIPSDIYSVEKEKETKASSDWLTKTAQALGDGNITVTVPSTDPTSNAPNNTDTNTTVSPSAASAFSPIALWALSVSLFVALSLL